ncbi:MAG: CehA/McbA family metallohydrolase, partial [Planctomycetaceae bacterium]
SRGPEYHVLTKTVRTALPGTPRSRLPAGVDFSDGSGTFTFHLKRWVHPAAQGFYSGDHHIHGAGCSHYESPTEGVRPVDMFAQVKGEGLNVGCILTWGPCFDFQRNYFNPTASRISEPHTVIKYDLEISGFGSAALGHVCLLNLKNQTYPESEGTKTKGWPTWTVPVLRWCKDQGGVTGYPHSAMHVNATSSAKRWLTSHDADKSTSISRQEASTLLMPESFEQMDADRDESLTERELVASFGRAATQLPNLAVPDMSGGGALEICVSTAEGVCDFISAMDTARIPEWNTWYHLMNCGFPLKLSGETDFPCMSSRRVGQGRVYVQLGQVDQVDFTAWCNGIAAGQSYVSDGYAHALRFEVNRRTPGTEDVALPESGQVQVRTTVAFSPRTPVGVAYGNVSPAAGRRMLGDTIHLHAPRSEEFITGGQRKIEVVVNGQVVAARDVPADGSSHDLEFGIEITHSSWVAVRQFPHLHSNPVNVIVGTKPIRASADSARWCIETIRELWRNRSQRISAAERPAARAAYDRAIRKYEQIILETH